MSRINQTSSSINNTEGSNNDTSSVNNNNSSSWDQMSSYSGYTSNASGRPIARIAPTPRARSLAESEIEFPVDPEMSSPEAESDIEVTVENVRAVPEYVSPEEQELFRDMIAEMGGPELSDRHLQNLVRDVRATRRMFFDDHNRMNKINFKQFIIKLKLGFIYFFISEITKAVSIWKNGHHS